MRLYLLIFFLSFCNLSGISQNYSISNVVLDPPSPDSTLLPNTWLNVNYNYTKIGGDIRINVYLLPGGNYAGGGAALKTENSGSGDSKFIFYNGGKIDGIKFEFIDLDWTVLHDTVIAVDYTYSGFYLNDVVFTPTSPGVLSFGDSIKFNFNYEKADMDVKIIPIAISNHNEIEKQTTSISPVYTGESGSGDGFIRIDSLASVDQIMFQFINVATNDTLVEIVKNVYFSFTNNTSSNYSISNVVFDPPSPGSLNLNEKVNFTFDYTKPYGNVRIDASPIVSEGSSNYGTAGSPTYTENSGSGDFYFVFYDESKVEKVRFMIRSISEVILYQKDFDVLYTFLSDPNSAYSISNVVFNPAPPLEVNTVDTIKFTFDYNSPFGNFKIFARPFENGNLKIGYAASGSEIYDEKSGSGNGFIIYNQPSSFDQVRFQFQSYSNQTLYETFVDAEFTITVRLVSAGYLEDETEFLIYPVPTKNKIHISSHNLKEFQYSIIDLSGRTILSGVSNENTKEIDLGQITKGSYIVKIFSGGKNLSKLIVIE
ncbi:MAG: T9SS type A sorting domain-containing protein [Draconibacterium sp.]|nr:T9SS type A sorting domain-containing protein [Draconibacterium sp.]